MENLDQDTLESYENERFVDIVKRIKQYKKGKKPKEAKKSKRLSRADCNCCDQNLDHDDMAPDAVVVLLGGLAVTME